VASKCRITACASAAARREATIHRPAARREAISVALRGSDGRRSEMLADHKPRADSCMRLLGGTRFRCLALHLCAHATGQGPRSDLLRRSPGSRGDSRSGSEASGEHPLSSRCEHARRSRAEPGEARRRDRDHLRGPKERQDDWPATTLPHAESLWQHEAWA